jgi:protein-S-isoprenylcysteine O-methyltransferase Ste14
VWNEEIATFKQQSLLIAACTPLSGTRNTLLELYSTWPLMLLAQHWLVISIGIVSMGLIYHEIWIADQEGIDKFGDAYRSYMQRVPRANVLLSLFRII